MKNIHFYALKGDLLSVLEAVERAEPLQYVLYDNSTKPDFPTYSRGSDIPNLGKSNLETGSTITAYVVGVTTIPMKVDRIRGTDGRPRYCMDQSLNPDTVVFTPAGLWGDDIVLNGKVSTVSDSPIAQKLMRRFNTAFNNSFTRVKAFRVGPEAFALLKAGKRLTLSVHSARTFDLTTEPES